MNRRVDAEACSERVQNNKPKMKPPIFSPDRFALLKQHKSKSYVVHDRRTILSLPLENFASRGYLR